MLLVHQIMSTYWNGHRDPVGVPVRIMHSTGTFKQRDRPRLVKDADADLSPYYSPRRYDHSGCNYPSRIGSYGS
jgi:hypothetical protein